MAGRRDGQPTVAEIARRAGVSPATVSKAINGKGQLRSETRAAVLKVAADLGLSADYVARGAAAGRSYTVGIIGTDAYGRFAVPVMRAIEDALDAGQISALLADARGDRMREHHSIAAMLARGVEGLVFCGHSAVVRAPVATPVPCVYALTQSTDERDCSIVVDDEQGIGLAVRHLVQTGRSRLAHIAGPQLDKAAQLRESGFRRALGELGLAPVVGETLWGEFSEAWGREAARMLIREGLAVDGITCASDQIARGAADAIREAGRSIPSDIALVGFDNRLVMIEGSRPLLTTVDLNLAAIGQRAGEEILRAINGGPRPGVHRVPCRLVIRASTHT